MTSGVRTPLTAIAATPRKEVESKFTFNPVSGKVISLFMDNLKKKKKKERKQQM